MGHYYDAAGKPRHEYTNDKGKVIPMCFPRVAQENLFPSVSTVIKDTLANGQLVEYAKRQVAEAAWGNPPNSDSIILPANCELSNKEFWINSILEASLEDAGEAADLGTAVHASIENYLAGNQWCIPEHVPYLDCVRQFMAENHVEVLRAEHAFSDKDYGYGGTIDLACKVNGLCCIVDWKGLPLSTKIPCPSGWTTMADIKVGDYIYGSDGAPTMVIGKGPIFNRPCYRITFDDGSSIDCDNKHEWTVIIGNNDVRTLDSDSLYNEMAELEKSGRQRDIRIKNTLPIYGVEQSFPIHPYLIGAWLGDGDSRGPSITLGESKHGVASKIKELGYDIRKSKAECRFHISGVVDVFRSLGVLNNKHVPQQFMRGSVEQRLELLRGLMDTDGSWNIKRNQCLFCNTNKSISDSVYELVMSLGWKASRYTGEGHGFGVTCTYHRVTFTPFGMNPFSGNYRNRELAQKRIDGTVVCRRRLIKSIKPIESVPTQCIAVDSTNHLFLAGEQMIPTHNTRRTKPEDKKLKPYESHPLQIAAYAQAYFGLLSGDEPIGCNVYLSTTEPGRMDICWYSAEELRHEFTKFSHLLSYWQMAREYYPHKNLKRETK